MSDWQPIETAPKDGTHILLHLFEPKLTIVAKYKQNESSQFKWETVGGDTKWNDIHAWRWQSLPKPPTN